jgi:nucleoside-diphosphate-sugar epimerase
MDVVHADDVARAMLRGDSVAGGQAFNIGHHSVTLNDFYAHYGRMLNRPVRHLPMGVVHGVHGLLRAMPAQMLTELRQGVKSSARWPTA